MNNILNTIAQTLFDKKGRNVLALDVHNVSSLTDYIVIAEGNADRHVKALADALVEQLKPVCGAPHHVDGLRHGDWIVLDYGDFIVHLFTPELREYYSLERLWREGHIVNVVIDTKENP